MCATGVDNVNGNANDNNIIFNIRNTKLYVPVVTLSARDNQKLSKLFSKGFERSVYWNEYKQKSENKAKTNEYRYFLKSIFVGVNRLFVLAYLNIGNDVKRFKTRIYYLPKGIIKYYNAILIWKIFYDEPIDSDIKQYKKIRKLTTGQGEDYTNHTTGCLLDYDYIKNHYRLITVELCRQEQLDADHKAIQQIEFVVQIKKLDGVNCDRTQNMFVLTILEKIKKTRLIFFQGRVSVLSKMLNYQEARVKLANIQLKKLKFATKNKTGTISRLNKKKV